MWTELGLGNPGSPRAPGASAPGALARPARARHATWPAGARRDGGGQATVRPVNAARAGPGETDPLILHRLGGQAAGAQCSRQPAAPSRHDTRRLSIPRILVTGSRDWTDREAIAHALLDVRDQPRPGVPSRMVLVHGACPTGADAIADEWATAWGWEVERHPAEWETHGRAAGPIRNQKMVDLGADVCLAFPLPGSRGTRHCMGAAERAGIPVREVTPTS